jgi:large-conductance mechanosensitive channel
MVKIVNKIRLQDEEPKLTPPPPEDVLLLREIRDSLQKSSN